MVDYARESLRSDMTFSDLLVAVFVACKAEFRIVQMYRFQPVNPDCSVKFFENSVKAVDDVKSAVVYMAGVKTNTEKFRMLRSVNYSSQFLKAASYLAALARHRFKQNSRFL